jgi:type VI secretion system protein ImpL
MKRPVTISIASATLMLFALLGMLLPRWMKLDTPLETWILRVGLWFLGIVAAALVFWWLKSREGEAPVPQEGADEIDVTISAARTRLASARGKANARFGRLPLILVTGPAGAAKTTIVTRSGMEPELLAGEVHRGDSVVPTQAVNVWFAQNHLVLEAGGRITADASRWRTLLRHVQPNRLAAVFTRGRQAPRLAVVCFGCDELLKPGAAEAVPAAAQKLRARLAEVSQQLGIRLPVYVIFTKTDRLPYFEDFVRSMTRDEASDVLGVTLPILPSGNVGQYAERESRRLSDAFHSVFRGLAMRRLDVMPRETQDVLRAGAYEFPREFRKIQDLASQFMLDLCRPSQLGLSPFLRGFYFTGVRAVYLHDAGVAPSPQPAAAPGATAMDATGVFDPRMLQRGAAPIAPTPAVGSRKVPEWAFLTRVFKEVILRDGVAQGVTGGGTKVNFLRRVAIASVAAGFLVISMLMSSSCFNTRQMLDRARIAVDGSTSIVRTGPLPELDALQRLDLLRQSVEELNERERQGSPFLLNWGLYSGSNLQPQIRQLYFQRFGTLLWDPTRTALIGRLSSLPDRPDDNSDYDSSYDALKAHLVTTLHPEFSEVDFLVPVLMRHWMTYAEADSSRQALAAAQFSFFAEELPHGNPLPQSPDEALVARTRTFLKAFSGEDQLYSYLRALARDSVPSIPWSGPPVINSFVVPGEYTAAGWDKAQGVLRGVQHLLDREPWVLGSESTVSEVERVRLEKVLRERYTRDYVNTWLRFLQSASLAAFSSVDDAANKLRTLTTNPSPLLKMIGLASNNTADSVLVGNAFKPAHTVSAPNVTTVTEAGGTYIGALTNLQVTVEQVARSAGPMRDQAQIQANTAAQQARGAIGGLAQTFDTEGDAAYVGAQIRRLLELPVINAETAIGRVSLDELNGKGRDFCGPFRSLGGKFPFNAASNTEAGIQEISDLLAPGTGALWSFYNENLMNLLERRGSQYAARAGANPRPNPAFVQYFNYLAQVSNAFFNENVEGPQLFIGLRMQPSFSVIEINLTISRTMRFTQSAPSAPVFDWTGAATPARLVARIENEDVTIVDAPSGPWSVFRLFYSAELRRTGPGVWAATWRPPGRQDEVQGEVRAEDGLPILQRGSLNRVASCVQTIAVR